MDFLKTLNPKAVSNAAIGVATMGLALGTATSAQALNIGGVVFNGGAHFEVASIFENIITGNGQTLSGYGEVSSINGVGAGGPGGFCDAAGCELTYKFGGFVSKNVTASTAAFTGGWINFYVDTTPDFNGTETDASNITHAMDGTLWLTLSGHSQIIGGVTAVVFGAGSNIGSGLDQGTGTGLLDIDNTGSANGNLAGPGALANANFDTNSFIDAQMVMADVVLNSNFGTAPPLGQLAGQCSPKDHDMNSMTPPIPGGILDPSLHCLVGSADITANVKVSEPASLAVLGLGLLGLGALRRRRTTIA